MKQLLLLILLLPSLALAGYVTIGVAVPHDLTMAITDTTAISADINGGTGRAITDYTTESGSYDGNAKFQMRDIQ